jgi:hypothetical protein
LDNFFARWFVKFPWHNEDCPEEFKVLEPRPAPTPADPDATRPVTLEETGLTEEEYHTLKARRDNALDRVRKEGKLVSEKDDDILMYLLWIQQLRRRFHRQTGKSKVKSGTGAEKFSGLLKLMCKVGPSPRRVLEHKWYMNHPDYQERCAQVYSERWELERLKPDFNPKLRLSFQCEVAKELYLAEDDEVKEKIMAETKADHDEKMATYKQLVNGEKFALGGVEAGEFGELAQEMCV